MKYDNLARSLSMMEDELKRADERVKNAEAKVVVIEDELAAIGENQKQLEVSEEKARKREEKYQVCLINGSRIFLCFIIIKNEFKPHAFYKTCLNKKKNSAFFPFKRHTSNL
jgi:hypothetical protein